MKNKENKKQMSTKELTGQHGFVFLVRMIEQYRHPNQCLYMSELLELARENFTGIDDINMKTPESNWDKTLLKRKD